MANKTKRKVENEIKKMHPLTKFIVILVLLVGIIGGFFAGTYLQRNDKFELIGEDTITIFVGGEYQEPDISNAVVCISFGRNVSYTVSIDENQSTYDPINSIKEAGKYYIVYATSDFKYSSINRIRTIIVQEIDSNEDGLGE